MPVNPVKITFLVISGVLALALLGAIIYWIVQAVNFSKAVNQAVTTTPGTGGGPVVIPANGNTLDLTGNISFNGLVVFRWDHTSGDSAHTNLNAQVVRPANATFSNVAVCTVLAVTPPTLATCQGFNLQTSNSIVCFSASESLYVGIYSIDAALFQPYNVQLTWTTQAADQAVCTGIAVITTAVTALGLLGIGIILAALGCCFLICCGIATGLGIDVGVSYRREKDGFGQQQQISVVTY